MRFGRTDTPNQPIGRELHLSGTYDHRNYLQALVKRSLTKRPSDDIVMNAQHEEPKTTFCRSILHDGYSSAEYHAKAGDRQA